MKRRTVLIGLCAGIIEASATGAEKPSYRLAGNHLSQTAPPIHILLTGLGFGESPRWHRDRLWFSNWGKQEVVAVDLKGRSEVMVRLSFASFPFSIRLAARWAPTDRLDKRPAACAQRGRWIIGEPCGS
jgi:hypothetical protein